MKYFTADLYERFNSRDVDVADRADDQWKKAEARYEARLQRIRGGLPDAVRELADELCLHDAEIMAIGHDDARASIVARQGSSLYWLSYGLSRAMESTRSRRAAAFSREPVVWLYDEVDMPAAGRFVHRILLSDGQQITLTFEAFKYRSMEIRSEEARGTVERAIARSNGHAAAAPRRAVRQSRSGSKRHDSKKRSAKRRG
jgi:hypothetical protein